MNLYKRTKMTMENFDYNDFFESNRKRLKLDDFLIARVIAEYKGGYKVKDANGEYAAKITGKQIFNASTREDYPAVGDWVAITKLNDEQATINKILPRKTIIKRKSINRDEVQVIATNIDVAFIVESVNRDFNLNRFERYLSITNDGGITPIIILNKIDLISENELNQMLTQIKNRFGDINVIPISTLTNDGVDKLKECVLKEKTYCFLGSSGVGKSSLINKLLEEDLIKTETIGSRTDRGKHATTNREMYFLKNGAMVIDNPGMREVGITDVESGINQQFDDIITMAEKCKYADCTHVHEPDCAVLSAVESGELDKEKYQNYINLRKEAEFYKMTKFAKKEKDRKFGKFLKTVKKDIYD